MVVPTVLDRARSAAPTEKVPNEANEENSPLRAYMACGASVLHHAMTDSCSDAAVFVELGSRQAGASVCDTDFDAASLRKSYGLSTNSLRLAPLRQGVCAKLLSPLNRLTSRAHVP